MVRDYGKDTPSLAARFQGGGAVEAGNIDLHNRPRVKNPDGTYSTVRSMNFEEDGKHVLVPTVHPEGRIMSDDEAIDRYHKTGEHLGIFSSREDAENYGEKLHKEQEQEYGE